MTTTTKNTNYNEHTPKQPYSSVCNKSTVNEIALTIGILQLLVPRLTLYFIIQCCIAANHASYDVKHPMKYDLKE